MEKKVLLMILDGWGIGKHDKSNAIYTAGEPNIDALAVRYPHSQLLACGENVGLPDGQMGNSEVGHLNIGAGRIVYQDLVKINKACQNKALLENKEIKGVYDYVKSSGKALHFMGLVSNGGVHSSLEHLFAFLDLAKEYGLEKVYVHCFMDGRDTDPKSGKGFIEELERKLSVTGGNIASIIGRFYAMDRDKRWDRIKTAYDLLVNGAGAKYTDPVMSSLTSSTTSAKVGLLRYGELMVGQFDRYENNTYYWALTPYSTSNIHRVDNYSTATYGYSASSVFGIRPSVNLKSNVVITGGDGTKQKPFTLELAS